MQNNEQTLNPRVAVIQKLYSYYLNKETEITFNKHRYKKYIKDVVLGSIERNDIIEELIKKELNDEINNNKTEFLVKLMLKAAIYEFMFMHKTPIKVIITEYLKVSDFFFPESQKKFLNVILDKISKKSRV